MVTPNKKLLPLAILAAFVGIQTNAAVNIHFQEVGSDIHATWEGTLSLDATAGSTTTFESTEFNGASRFYNSAGTSGEQTYRAFVGTTSGPSGSSVNSFGYAGTANANTTFGFYSGYIYYDSNLVTGGTAANPTELSFSNFTIVLSGKSHSTLFSTYNLQTDGDVVAWTHDVTGDTISYTASPIPEPATTVALTGLIVFAMATLKRRPKS